MPVISTSSNLLKFREIGAAGLAVPLVASTAKATPIINSLNRFLGAALTLFVCTMSSVIQPASAGVLTGETVNVTHFYPNSSTPYLNMGTQVVPTGTFAFEDKYTIVVDDNAITYNDGPGSQFWANFGFVTFNGPMISVLSGSPILNVTIDPTTSYAGFDVSRLSFDSSHVWINLQGLYSDGFIKLNLTDSNSVPAPGALALLGLGMLGIRVKRRKHA
ncbi:MAG: PEP-CTERM sorting domain-containing protein [Rhodobacteraceae bacterium]|nr:PEP-CTERM sorting domain-containing protein [Paracoccaceae bacterium]